MYSLLAYRSSQGRTLGLYREYKELSDTPSLMGICPTPGQSYSPTRSIYDPCYAVLFEHRRRCTQILPLSIRTRYTRVSLAIDNEWQKKLVLITNIIGKRHRKLAIQVCRVIAGDFQLVLPITYQTRQLQARPTSYGLDPPSPVIHSARKI